MKSLWQKPVLLNEIHMTYTSWVQNQKSVLDLIVCLILRQLLSFKSNFVIKMLSWDEVSTVNWLFPIRYGWVKKTAYTQYL